MKMQKSKVAVAILLSGCILSGCILGGCTRSEDTITKKDTNNVFDSKSQGQSVDSAAPDGAFTESETMLSNETGDLEEVPDLWYGNHHKLIVKKAKKLYLYDMKTEEVVSQTDTENWYDVEIYPYDKGYCAIGAIGDVESDEGDNLCVIYNERLQETKRISLNDMVENAIFTPFAISADGSKLAYFDSWEGLHVYHLKKDNNIQVMDVGEDTSYQDRKNILAIDALYFKEDGKSLVFSAQTTKKQITYESWGRINIDGSGLENHILDKQLGNAITYKNGRLLFGEDSLTFCSGMGYVNVKEKSQKYSTDIPIGSGVGGPKVSQDGGYFGVAELEGNSVRISIYRTSDFKLIHQETITDDKEGYFYRIPKIYLFDELQTGLVCMGGHHDIPLKTVKMEFDK